MSYQREFPHRLRAGLVGIGSHAYRNILPVMNFLPVQLVAVCNRSNVELAQLTAAQYGCKSYQKPEEMYEKEHLDCVFICVSPEAHPGLVIQALEAGIHVWVEKPAAMNSEQILQMIEARKDRVALVGYKKAFMPAVTKAREVIQSEKYGNLESILAVYPMKMPQNWAEVMRQGLRTDWLNNGCHPLSVMLATGGAVESVVSVQNRVGHGADIIKFKNGAVGTFHLASGPQPIEEYHFYSSKWHLHIDDSSKVTLQRGIPFIYHRNTSFTAPGDECGAVVWEVQNCRASLDNQAAFVQGMYQEMMEFCNCVLESRKPDLGSLEFALELTKTAEALAVSNGNEIKLS